METAGSMQKKLAEGNTIPKQTHVRTCVKFNLIIAQMFINLISKKLSQLTLTKKNFYFTHTRISRKQIFLPIRSAALTNSDLWCNVKDSMKYANLENLNLKPRDSQVFLSSLLSTNAMWVYSVTQRSLGDQALE